MTFEEAKAMIVKRWGPPEQTSNGTATWGGMDLWSANGVAMLEAGGEPWRVTKRDLARVLRDLR